MEETFALMNPLVRFLDKEPKAFLRKDFIRLIKEKRLERLTLHYTALDGKLKELKIPITDEKQAERILADGERVDGSSLFKGMIDPSLSDLYVVPVYKSAFLNPFDSGSLDFICRYLTESGDLAPFAPDSILLRASELFQRQHGCELWGFGELEFYLLGEATTPIYQNRTQKGYHASAPFVKSGDILNEMMRDIAQITGCVKYAHSEVGYIDSVRSNLDELANKRAEQLEIEFLPEPITDAGDHLVLARWLIRNIAYKYGCVASFLPKLEEGIAGNGMHVHLQLVKDGKNIMTQDDGQLSLLARKMIGGMCHYADTLTAFGNTTSSAYLRLVPNQEAPTRICWSDRNRSALIRVPLGWSRVNNLANKINPQQQEDLSIEGSRQTVELRSPDGSAFIHLLLAGLTMAAEWGFASDDALDIAKNLYVTGNIFKDKERFSRLPALPKSCVESARFLLKNRQRFEHDAVFPCSVIDYIAKMLEQEQDENMNAVLADLPADDRLHATRKIMHKDVHRH